MSANPFSQGKVYSCQSFRNPFPYNKANCFSIPNSDSKAYQQTFAKDDIKFVKTDQSAKEIFEEIMREVEGIGAQVNEIEEISNTLASLRLERASLETEFSGKRLKEAELSRLKKEFAGLQAQNSNLDHQLNSNSNFSKELEVKALEFNEIEGRFNALAKMKETLTSTNSHLTRNFQEINLQAIKSQFSAQAVHLQNQLRLKEMEKTQKSATLSMAQNENSNLFSVLDRFRAQEQILEGTIQANSISFSSIETLKAENYGLESNLATILKEIHEFRSKSFLQKPTNSPPSNASLEKLRSENEDLKEQLEYYETQLSDQQSEIEEKIYSSQEAVDSLFQQKQQLLDMLMKLEGEISNSKLQNN